MAYSAGQSAFKLAFEISPITLTNGIAANIPGGTMPLMSLLQAASYATGLLGSADFELDDAFGNFYPLPGSSLIKNEVAKYPMANMAIAANAIIKQPINVSLMMRCPVRDAGGYAAKLSIMTGLQSTLAQHCASGGTFIVATPSFFYTDCLLTDMHDISGGEGLQAQVTWRFDFEKPLISLQDAQAAQNSMMQQLSNGTPTDGATSGLDVQSTQTAATAGFIPASTTTAGAGVAAYPSSFGIIAGATSP